MKISISAIFLIIVVSFIFSCSQKNNEPSIEYNSIMKTFNDCDNKSDTCAFVKIMYPVISIDENEASENRINNFIGNQLLIPLFGENSFNNIDEMITNFFDEYIHMRDDFNDYDIPWVLEKNIEVNFASEDIISIIEMTYSYAGGAHPNTIYNYYTLKTIDGSQIELTDLIKSDQLDSFKNALLKEFKLQNAVHPDSTLESAGYWFNDEFFLPDNFILTESGLSFLYNTYEVAPYALGTSGIEIKYIDYKKFFRNDINYWINEG